MGARAFSLFIVLTQSPVTLTLLITDIKKDTMDVIQRIAEELSVNSKQVKAAVALLDEGATVPFIARYRKEITGGLDDTQLRNLEERLHYLRELNERRKTIVDSIR